MKNIPKKVSKKHLEKILSSYYGRRISVSPAMEEDLSRWSGQVWDDGPLPEKFVGLFIEKVIKK